MKILHLITAREGSKGVPNKNIREIAGIPLVGYKAIAAMRSHCCDRLIISSDSQDIINNAINYGAEAPFIRPKELASDNASSFDVISHAMDYIEREEGTIYDAIMLLEPSSPFATWKDLDNASAIMKEKEASLVVGVVEHKINTINIAEMDRDGKIPSIIHNLKNMSNMNRQTKPKQYTINGALYLFRWEGFRRNKTIYYDCKGSYGYIMSPYCSVEIDEEIDLKWAEFLVQNGYINLAPWR